MAHAAMMIDLPKTQDALREPEVWNNKWESLCKRGVFTPSLVFNHEQSKTRVMSTTLIADEYSQLLESTLELRTVVGGRYVLFGDDFDSNWRSASQEVRRRHALFAISESCSVARNLNDARAQTSDILTLSNLCDDGQTVVDLIRAMLPDDLSSVCRDVYYYPNAVWDDFKDAKFRSQIPEKDKVVIEYILLLRTKLICEHFLNPAHFMIADC